MYQSEVPAIQFVPEIQPHVKRLHLFQRTPPWVLPRENPRIPASWQRRFARHPRLLRAARQAVFSLFESLATIEPRAEAQARFMADVDEGTEGSVWTAGGCVSWYLDSTGRNSTLWPGSVRAYQRRLARFEPSEYRVELPRPARVRDRIAA